MRGDSALEARKQRIQALLNLLKDVKDVDLEDLYSELALNWGLKRARIKEYLGLLQPKYIKIEKGRVIYVAQVPEVQTGIDGQ